MSYSMINKLLLINSVRERPALWDISSEKYKIQSLRTAAWREICGILKNDYSKLPQQEQKEFYKYVIKIWTHLRDSWARSLNSRKHAKKAGVIVRPYKYHDEMRFLKKRKRNLRRIPLHNCEESESSENNEEEVVIEESGSDSVVNNDWNTDQIKDENNKCEDIVDSDENDNRDDVSYKSGDSNRLEKLTSFIDNRIKQHVTTTNTQQEGRHLAFFKSIQPTLNLLDDDQILEFQSGVINVLRSVKRRGGSDWSIDQPSSSSRGYYRQPVVQNIPHQPMVAPPEIASSSAVSDRGKSDGDPLKTE